MRIQTVLKIVILTIAIGLFLLSTISIDEGLANNIYVDTSMPLSIIWPFEIAVVGNEGEKGLRIAPKIGRGWRGEAGGESTYSFYIPEDGTYYIWAYALWYDQCSNTIFAKIDDMDKAIIGNDPIYNQWHWTRGFSVDLKKGTHKLDLSNHSDNVSLQKIFLTDSAIVKPSEAELAFSDIFYDGFNGCDQGNFSRWCQVGGSWSVKNPDSQSCLVENVLVGQSSDNAFIILENNGWRGYSFDFLIKIPSFNSQNCALVICFGLTDPNSYYQLQIQPSPNNKEVEISIVDKDLKSLFEYKSNFEVDKWQQIQIALKEDFVEIIIANNNPVKVETNSEIIGGIGFLLKGYMTVYFDDVHVREIIEITDQRK